MPTNSQDQDIDGWLSLGSATIVAGNTGNSITKVSNISLSQSTAIMSVGDNLQLSAVVSPALATNSDITWVSDHPGTASVSANGYVSAGPSYGEAVISAIAQDGGLRAECILNVEPISVNLPAKLKLKTISA